MITDRDIDQAYSDLRGLHGGLREDYFGLLYLEDMHKVPRERAVNQIALGGNDYGLDGFHYDETRRNLYLFQFKWSPNYALFKISMNRLVDKGIDQIFRTPNKDESKNEILVQLRGCILENRNVIDQVIFRFVFTGDPESAERSEALRALREELEDKKYLIDQFFSPRPVQFIVEFQSNSGRVGPVRQVSQKTSFPFSLTQVVTANGPNGEKLYVGFLRLWDLHIMHENIGPRFFDKNIRYGLGSNESVNRSIARSLREIVIDHTLEPAVFAFNHNGITLFAEEVWNEERNFRLTAPRLLNGAQTVTTIGEFVRRNQENTRFKEGQSRLEEIRVLCKILADAGRDFVTQVTINNNRQNPVEPWNLHANDPIQLEMYDKLNDDLGIYYERQENAFDQLSTDDLEEYGIKEWSRAVQMLKLTQTFVLTDGNISRLSVMKLIFEDDKIYNQVFRQSRLLADSRQIVLCYKVERRLRKLGNDIIDRGSEKYSFISRARSLLWALICQGILNDPRLEEFCDSYGKDLTVSAGYTEFLSTLAINRVRPLLGQLLEDPEYKSQIEENKLGFLRSDRAFEKCMKSAYERWKWVQKKLG
jgi:hypothetical protein